MKDYYKILEVNPSASQDVIAKVYKVLAKKYHPDMQSNPSQLKEAEEKFKEISEAYDVLSHPDQREKYDAELQEEKSANSIDINEYLELQQYCKDLENQINAFSSQSNQYQSTQQQSRFNTGSNNQANYQAQQQSYQKVEQQAYKDAMNKAYQDTYYNTLRSMGYKIRYKKTFKEQLKNLLALGILALILFILFKIPAFQNYIKSLLTF